MTLLTLLLALLLPHQAPPAPRQEIAPQASPEPVAKRFDTRHALKLGTQTLEYRAVAESTFLRDEAGEAEAEFFSFAYLAEDTDPATRPITFAFNGGPGSSSIWLHMGLVGPRIVEVPGDGQGAGAPPYPLLENPDSLLAVSDLVFVDPIGTGFSRVVGAGESEDHWGVDEDARSVARFVRRYLSEHGRWASPKYLLGESYGGIRSALLVRELQSGFDVVALNGVILISPALDMGIVDGQENDAALATVLPTYAAIAHYHGALSHSVEDLDTFLQRARAFVDDEYVPALFAGADLSEPARAGLALRLQAFTGLSPDYLRRAHLRVLPDRFRRELLRDRGLVVGRLDARYTGTEADEVGELPSGDPLSAGISGAYVAAFHDYLFRELSVSMDRDYQVMSGPAARSWKRPQELESAFQGYLDVTPALARGMADNPQLRLFIASGLYDLATTFFGAEYNVRRSTMDRSRVTLRTYPAGHMMYVNASIRAELAAEIRRFETDPDLR